LAKKSAWPGRVTLTRAMFVKKFRKLRSTAGPPAATPGLPGKGGGCEALQGS